MESGRSTATASQQTRWSRYDYPLLQAIVRRAHNADAGMFLPSDNMIEEVVTSSDPAERFQFQKALVYLTDDGFIEGVPLMEGEQYPSHILKVMPKGLRAVGEWPNPQSVADTLLARLSQEAESVASTNPEKGKRLKEAALFLGTGARDVVISVVSDVLAKTFGIK